MTGNTVSIRYVQMADVPALRLLEDQVTQNEKMETISADVFYRWVSTNPEGFFLAHREGVLVGYAYCEVADIDLSPGSDDWQKIVQYHLGGIHNPLGNSWYGISLATVQPGVARLLFRHLTNVARKRKCKQFVTIARLSGLSKYFRKISYTCGERRCPERDLTMARYYAIACARKKKGVLGPYLEAMDVPKEFASEETDPVFSKFVHSSTLLDVVKVTSFDDADSCGFGAVIVFQL